MLLWDSGGSGGKDFSSHERRWEASPAYVVGSTTKRLYKLLNGSHYVHYIHYIGSHEYKRNHTTSKKMSTVERTHTTSKKMSTVERTHEYEYITA